MKDAFHKWAPILISIASLLVAVIAVVFTWHQFQASSEALSVDRTSPTPELVVEYNQNTKSATLVSRIELRISNLSKDPASVTELECDVGYGRQPQGPYPDEFPIRFTDSCRVFLQRQEAEVPISAPINIGAKSSTGIMIVARYPAPPTTHAYLSTFLTKNEFNDENFLLFLALNKTDFFGTNFPKPYQYLQKTFGQYLCLGGTIGLTGKSSLGSTLSWITDFYVGPMLPVTNCEGRTVVILEGSEPFRTDFWNPATAPF